MSPISLSSLKLSTHQLSTYQRNHFTSQFKAAKLKDSIASPLSSVSTLQNRKTSIQAQFHPDEGAWFNDDIRRPAAKIDLSSLQAADQPEDFLMNFEKPVDFYSTTFDQATQNAVTHLTQSTSYGAFNHLPEWDLVQATDIVKGLNAMLTVLKEDFQQLETSATAHLSAPTWESIMVPFEKLGEDLGKAQARIYHLQSVNYSSDMQTAFDEVRPALVEFSITMGQSRALFDALMALQNSNRLDPVQARIVENSLKSMKHQGVGLDGSEREQFLNIQQQLASLSSDFSNHLVEEAKNERIIVTNADQLKGIPQSVIDAAAKQAQTDVGADHKGGIKGPWHFSLDGSTYMSVLQNCEARALREGFFKRFAARGTQGDYANTQILADILKLKQAKAQMLGFDNAAQMSLDTKMAPSESAVINLMDELKTVASPIAEQELEQLVAFAQSQDSSITRLEPWDMSFWNEAYVKAHFNVDQEALRQYFQAPKVMDSLFNMMHQLFGLEIAPVAHGQVPTWDKDVQFYQIKEEGQPIAGFFMDPYARPGEKRGGAWMNTVVDRSKALAGPEQTSSNPVALFIMNIRPPQGDTPGLLSLDDVETLFHEFGHALQHMLTRVEEGDVSGINGVEWDAVEVASQFNENWVYRPEFLKSVSSHVTTGESLDDETIDKIIQSRNYFAANNCLRQLSLSLMDFKLHQEYGLKESDPKITPQAIENQVRKATLKTPYIESLSTLPAFSHIFAGGYSAGYYSYKWAEVMAADAFAAFEEAGLDNPQALKEQATKYRNTILAEGGSRPAGEVYRDFRGKDATPEALLRHQGLLAAS